MCGPAWNAAGYGSYEEADVLVMGREMSNERRGKERERSETSLRLPFFL